MKRTSRSPKRQPKKKTGSSNPALRAHELDVVKSFPAIFQEAPPASWPVQIRSVGPRRRAILRRQVLVGQDVVSLPVVRKKMDRIAAGEDLLSDVLLVDGQYWMVDGTHTMAAYAMLGKLPRALVQKARRL